jgi:putative endonuclease
MESGVHEKGVAGESLACTFLEEQGFTIIEKNYHAGKISEIDIIAAKEKLVVFAEVKLRSSDSFGGGVMSITKSKKNRLKKAGTHFLASHLQFGREYMFRFDLISITNGDTIWVKDIIR